MAERKRIFVSYAHRDAKWLEEFQTYLAPYVRNAQVIAWTDEQLRPGERWKDAIEAQMQNADVGVLLVTQNFLASPFIAETELPALLQKRVFWIAVHASAYKETALADLQCANDPARPLTTLPSAKRGAAWLDICNKLKAILASASAPPSTQATAPTSGPSISGTVNVGSVSGGNVHGVHIENYNNYNAPPPAGNAPAPSVVPSNAPCVASLQSLDSVELWERIGKRLSFDEVELVWYATFGDSLKDVRPNDSKSSAIRVMVTRAEQHELMERLLSMLCHHYPHVANP